MQFSLTVSFEIFDLVRKDVVSLLLYQILIIPASLNPIEQIEKGRSSGYPDGIWTEMIG